MEIIRVTEEDTGVVAEWLKNWLGKEIPPEKSGFYLGDGNWIKYGSYLTQSAKGGYKHFESLKGVQRRLEVLIAEETQERYLKALVKLEEERKGFDAELLGKTKATLLYAINLQKSDLIKECLEVVKYYEGKR